jgi:prepilin-type N-terminal cleavage/methylation domain-containing protein
MTRMRDSRGFTLIEMLVVCSISLVVFGATLSAFTSMYRSNRAVETQRDNVDEARLALDRAARQLRNLANPTATATTTIDRATDYDFIFQTSDPNKTWVRYCLDVSGVGASPSAGRLWMAESPNGALSASMRGACPGTGWARRQIVAQHVTNEINGQDRNVFTYGCMPGSPSGCPAGTADYPKLTTVGAQIYVDANTRDKVKEMQVSTGVFLRNQNEAPTAAVSGPSNVGTHKVSLNGTGSSDPEGRTLDFYWFSAPPPAAELADCSTPPPSAIWDGPVLINTYTTADVGTTKNYWLVVRDPGCLTSTVGPVPVPVT